MLQYFKKLFLIFGKYTHIGKWKGDKRMKETTKTSWIKKLGIFVLSFALAVSMLPGVITFAEEEEDPSSLVIEGDFNLGQLTAGYTKEEAKALEKEIIIKNIGDEELQIDPARATFYSSAFKKNFATELITIGPGKSASIGTIVPKHQLTPGVYSGYFSVPDTTFENYADTNVSLTVVSRTTEFLVLDQYDCTVSEIAFDPVYQSLVENREELLTLKNTSSGNVRFSLSSDNSLFRVEFADETVTEYSVFTSGATTGVRVSLNTRRAAALDADTYYGNLLFSATSEDGSGYTETVIPIEITTLLNPGWASNAVSSSIEETFSKNSRGKLDVMNTAGILHDLDQYLLTDVEEDELFTVSWDIYSECFVIMPKSALPVGEYSTEVDLYFDPNGNVEKKYEYFYGTCLYTLTVIPDNSYQLEIETDPEEPIVFLGTLTTGYTEADAEAMRTAIKVKNTGLNPLTLSSEGLTIYDSHDDSSFINNTPTPETIGHGETYDKVWIQPKTGLDPGYYIASIYFEDDDEYTESNELKVYFQVVNEGISYQIELSGGLFDPNTPLGEDGIDFGLAAPGSEDSLSKWVIFTNTGSVPLKLNGVIENDTNGLYSSNLAENTVVEPCESKLIIVICEPKKVSQTIGVYEANYKLNLENTKDSSKTQTLNIPLKLEIGNAEMCDLTIDFQGKGGGEYTNTTMSFTKGTSFSDALTSIMSEITGEKYSTIPWPSDDNYTMISVTKKTDEQLAALGTWEAVAAAQKEVSEGTLTEDTTLYINWAKKLNSAVLSVKVPICGDPYPVDSDVTIIGENPHYTVSKAQWDSELVGATYYIGGENYQLDVTLTPEFGYSFAKDAEATINGRTAVNETPYSATHYAAFSGTLKVAGHDYGDWYPVGETVHAARCKKCSKMIKEIHHFNDWEETIEPTCTTPGEIVYTCAECGYEYTVEEPPLGHDLINETLEQKADNFGPGIYSYQCANCNETFEEYFSYRVTKGNDAVWYRDSNKTLRITFTRGSVCYDDEDMTFGFDMDQSKIQIKLDDTLLKSGDYSLFTTNDVETEVGLYSEVLNKLSEGEHTVAFIYEDGLRNAFFTVKTPQYINSVDLNIEHPVCGVYTTYGEDQYGRFRAENPPVITIDEKASYSINPSMYATRWCNADGSSMTGTFEGGMTAYASFNLSSNEGSVFANTISDVDSYPIYIGKVTVNGNEVTPIRQTLTGSNLRLLVPIEAIHAIDNASYTWAKDNTSVTAFGKCSCETCGKTVTEQAKAVSTITVKPTYTTTGIRTFTAVFKNAAFKSQTKQVVIPKLKKLANPLKASGSVKLVKASKVNKKNVTIKKAIKVKKAKGKVTYMKTKGSKMITVNKKTGAITVKKGLKPGKYTIKVKVNAAGTNTGSPQYRKGKKTVKVIIIIK